MVSTLHVPRLCRARCTSQRARGDYVAVGLQAVSRGVVIEILAVAEITLIGRQGALLDYRLITSCIHSYLSVKRAVRRRRKALID